MISKWGNLPLFKHHISDCPYYPNTISTLRYYWIKKPVISSPPESLTTGQRHTFSETRFRKSNMKGMVYYWEILTPSLLVQDSPNSDSIYTVKATSTTDTAKLCVNISTPSGQTNTSDTIVIIINPPPPAPDPDDFEVYIEELGGNGVPGSPGGPFELCVGEQYYVSLYPYFLFDDYGITDVEFDFTFDYDVLDEGDDYIEIEVNSSPEDEEGEVYVTSLANGYTTFKYMDFVEGTCSGYFMMFTPNPTTGETTLSIEQGEPEETILKSASTGETFDDNAEWDMEIYSPMQALKTKKTKLNGKSTTIQTAGWMEGIYSVRVKYKDHVLTGKLIVKR